MAYSLTDKLTFESNPEIEVNGIILTVQADAKTVLKVMDAVEKEGEVYAGMKAAELLFSKKDREKIDSLNLNMQDYGTLIGAAMQLAVGEDPDEDTEKKE